MGTELREPLVEVRNLKKYFPISKKKNLHAVDGVNFAVYERETLGLVGESGCGKSTVGNLLIGLLPTNEGEIYVEGSNTLAEGQINRKKYCHVMQMIFQDPYTSLNPQKTVKDILSEAYLVHGMKKGRALDEKIASLIDMAGIEAYVLGKYPHELDGGKRQLVGIARALSMNVKFVVCDEPVSALDVSIQATIINLLMDLQKKMGLSYLFISHDLSVVRHISSRIAVMYLGQIVEMAGSETIFQNTLHPYSIALLSAVPLLEFHQKSKRIVLEGDVPSPINPKPGCRFAPRCWMAREECNAECPELRELEPGHVVACHFAEHSRQEMRSRTEGRSAASP